MSEPYRELVGRLRECGTLQSVGALLGWDQETTMPPGAAEARAEELALVGRLCHERATDPRVGELLAGCEADRELGADPRVAANLREMRRDYDRATRLPADLVAEIARTSSRALEAWKEARRTSRFEPFRPWLERQVELGRRKAACLGTPPGGEPYDALLDAFEPQMTAAELRSRFAPLRSALLELIDRVRGAAAGPDRSIERLVVPREAQRRLCEAVLARTGFDLDRGRLDVSAHPFSSGIAPGDTRLTTRYREDGFPEALGSTLHEAGHALYEQGLPKAEHWGEPLADAISLGIHESQSRMWENQVGRSRPFWRWVFPVAREILGPALDGHTADGAWRAVNAVEPGLIRVESDEVTYNLHVMLRFDLERSMLAGDLAVADLPGAWNERMAADLGLAVPDDARGCLQDVHWSAGMIGYFPTYTLGNLYAAQFWETIRRDLPDLEEEIGRGEFGPLLRWLRERIHRHGRGLTARELCVGLTGRALDHGPLVAYLHDKVARAYPGA